MSAQTMKERREALGLAQEEVARRSGLSVRTVNRIERGWQANIVLSTAEALARVLGWTVPELLDALPKAEPEPAPASKAVNG